MLKVYQWYLTDADYDPLNSGDFGDGTNEKIEAHRHKFFSDFKAEDWFEDFTHVADVATDDLEEAYALMNHWGKPELITKHEPFIASLSMGDVLQDEDNRYFVVAAIGFRELFLDAAYQGSGE